MKLRPFGSLKVSNGILIAVVDAFCPYAGWKKQTVSSRATRDKELRLLVKTTPFGRLDLNQVGQASGRILRSRSETVNSDLPRDFEFSEFSYRYRILRQHMTQITLRSEI